MTLLATSPPTALVTGSPNPSSFSPESWRAAPYAHYRPTYPSALFHEILAYAQLQDSSPPPSFGVRPKEVMALDVGCGPAQTALGLISTGVFDRVVGIDPSEVMCRQASRMTHDMRSNGELPAHAHVHFIRGVVEALNWLPDGEADIIASSNSVQWWHDRPKAYAEFRRVLKPGGAVAIWSYLDPILPGYPALSRIITDLTSGLLGPYWVADPRKLCTDLFEDIPLPTNEPSEHEDAQQIADFGLWDTKASQRIRYDVLPEDCYVPPPTTLSCEHREPVLRTRWTITDIGRWIETLSSTIAYEEMHPDEQAVAERAVEALREAAGDDADATFDCAFPMAMLLFRKAR